MELQKTLIALHDYQHGGVGMLIKCPDSDIETLRHALGPSWELISENVEDHPFYSYAKESGQEEFDFANPSGRLARQLFISSRQAEGKSPVPVRGKIEGKFEYRNIWARSSHEVEEQFPSLELLYSVELDQKINKSMEDSDIDESDDFIRKYRQ